MITRSVSIVALSLAICAGVAGVARCRATVHALMRIRPAPVYAVDTVMPGRPNEDSLWAAATRAVAANPFRPDRAAPIEHLSPNINVVPAGLADAHAPLALRGLSGGPPWSAIISGLPNASAEVLLRVGDTVAGFSIERIKRDTVVLRSAGRLFTLTLPAR
jgi:hypothetical protein